MTDLFTIDCGKCGKSATVQQWCEVAGTALPDGTFQCPNCNWAFERKARTNRQTWDKHYDLATIPSRLL